MSLSQRMPARAISPFRSVWPVVELAAVSSLAVGVVSATGADAQGVYYEAHFSHAL